MTAGATLQLGIGAIPDATLEYCIGHKDLVSVIQWMDGARWTLWVSERMRAALPWRVKETRMRCGIHTLREPCFCGSAQAPYSEGRLPPLQRLCIPRASPIPIPAAGHSLRDVLGRRRAADPGRRGHGALQGHGGRQADGRLRVRFGGSVQVHARQRGHRDARHCVCVGEEAGRARGSLEGAPHTQRRCGGWRVRVLRVDSGRGGGCGLTWPCRPLAAATADEPPHAQLRTADVNDTAIIRRQPKMTAINSAIEVDITGQVRVAVCSALASHVWRSLDGSRYH